MTKKRSAAIVALMLAAAFLFVFLNSCSGNGSLILCNIKLDTSEASRSFDKPNLSNGVSSVPNYYSAIYKGNDPSCYGAVTHAVYDSKNGILLSQGLWEITCEWYDPDTNETIATGTTGDIWVNLNTTSFLVYLDSEDGKGSASLTYTVMDSVRSTTNIFTAFALSKLTVSSSTPVQVGTPSSSNITSKLKEYRLSVEDLVPGDYLLTISVFEDDTKSNLLFLDVLGFVVRSGRCTEIIGRCNVKTGQTGGSIYLPPTVIDPVSPPESVIVDVGNNKNQNKLNATPIEDGKIYYVQPDDNTSSNPSMNLGHTTDSEGNQSHKTSRISPPGNDSVFGINLNGTDVIMSTETQGYFGSGNYYSENALIIALENNSVMTIYNYNKDKAKNATWAYMEKTRRFDTNTILKDGQLNIVGSNASEDISNAVIVFLGPTCGNNESPVPPLHNVTEAGDGSYIKQGAINLESDSNHDGGSVVLDGDVIVSAVTGISSWKSKTASFTRSPYSYEWDSTINGPLYTDISILNNATINAVGDTKSGVNKDVATGIFILGKGQPGKINILLDNGHISASGSSDQNEAGIRIENFKGSVNITIRNPSATPSISSESGSGLFFKDCPNVNISIESSNPDSVISGASNQRITLEGSNLNLTVKDGTNKTIINNRTASVTSINSLLQNTNS